MRKEKYEGKKIRKKMKSLSIFVVCLLCLNLIVIAKNTEDEKEQSGTAVHGGSHKTGGWNPVDLTNEANIGRLQPIVQFILTSINARSNSVNPIRLNKIISADQQVVSGMKYKIRLELVFEDKVQNGDFVVYDHFGKLHLLNMKMH